MVQQQRPVTVLGDRLREGLRVVPVMGDALGLAVLTGDVGLETAVFEGVPESIGQARKFVTAALPGFAWADLVVSELATNALRHTESGVSGEFMVAAITWKKQAAVLVVDEGGTYEVPQLPSSTPSLSPDGRGLLLVDELAEDLGWIPTVSGHLVWAVLARDSSVPKAAER